MSRALVVVGVTAGSVAVAWFAAVGGVLAAVALAAANDREEP